MRIAISRVGQIVVFSLMSAMAPPGFADDEAEPAFDRAVAALHEAKYAEAIAGFDEAVRLQPNEAKCVGMRGTARLLQGDIAQGVADLKAAIALTPGDAGKQYDASATSSLSPESLEHGRRQVARMLEDRPAMALHGEDADFLRSWAARKFAGEDLGSLIDWDASPPLHSDAEHLAPTDHEHAAILVAPNYESGPKQGSPRSFEELWAGAVFELHNVNYAHHFVRLNREAEEGAIARDAFVGQIVKFELEAAQQTRAFYVQAFLPWVEKQKLATDPTLWFCDWWNTSETPLQGFTDTSAYPWRPYARIYDWATVHRDWHRGEFRDTAKLLEQMAEESGYDEDADEVYFWLGRCRAQLGEEAGALSAFGEAIRLGPRNAAAFRARSELYRKLGDKEKADADAATAKELEKEP